MVSNSLAAESDLEFLLSLLPPPKWWDERHVPPRLLYAVLWIKPKYLVAHCGEYSQWSVEPAFSHRSVCVCVLTKGGLEESKPVTLWFEFEMAAIGSMLNAWSPAP